MNYLAACCNHNCWMINRESNLPGLTVSAERLIHYQIQGVQWGYINHTARNYICVLYRETMVIKALIIHIFIHNFCNLIDPLEAVYCTSDSLLCL